MGWGIIKTLWDDTPDSKEVSLRTKRIEAMTDLYGHLRDEVIESIRFQNRVVLGETVIISFIYGIQLAILTGRLNDETDTIAIVLDLTAGILPLVIIVLTILWAVEQTRMMRIGDYLQLLENRINEELDAACISWENWLRSGNVSYVGTVHHTAKTVGYVGFFLLLGVLGLLLYVNRILLLDQPPTEFTLIVPISQIDWSSPHGIVFAVYVLAYFSAMVVCYPIIDYRNSAIGNFLEELLASGQRWTLQPDASNEKTSESEHAVADGGSINDEESWNQMYSRFKEWECCYQKEILGFSDEQVLTNTGKDELPEVTVVETKGTFSKLRQFISDLI